MQPTHFFLPQWQGGNKHIVHESALALRAHLAHIDFITIASGDEAPLENNIKHYRELLANFERVHSMIEKHPSEKIFLLGGDCGSDGVVITYLNQRYQGDLVVLWLDAHADLNTPESSPSKHYHGMPVRHILGEGDTGLQTSFYQFLKPDQIIYMGLRDTDLPEAERIAQSKMAVITSEAITHHMDALHDTLKQKGYNNLYIHLDMDILDPQAYPYSGYPTPNGVTIETLQTLLISLSPYNIVGGAVVEYVATNETDLEVPKTFFERLVQA